MDEDGDFDMRRQDTVGFNFEADEISFNEYREKVTEKERTQYLRTWIDSEVRHVQKISQLQTKQTDGYDFYFNYELNTKTWHQFVNKQIIQTYHRLVIEKQLKDAKKLEKDLNDQIAEVDRKVRACEHEKQKLEEGPSSGGHNMYNNQSQSDNYGRGRRPDRGSMRGDRGQMNRMNNSGG